MKGEFLQAWELAQEKHEDVCLKIQRAGDGAGRVAHAEPASSDCTE